MTANLMQTIICDATKVLTILPLAMYGLNWRKMPIKASEDGSETGRYDKREIPILHAMCVIYIVVFAAIFHAYRPLTPNAGIREMARTYLAEGLIFLFSALFAVSIWHRVYVVFLKKCSISVKAAYKAILYLCITMILAYIAAIHIM